MKTQLRIRSLRGLVTLAVVAALLNAVYAQPDSDNNGVLNTSEANLEAYIYNADQLLKYKAPKTTEMEISDPEIKKSLDLFVDKTEGVLKYKAPEFSEYEETSNIDPFIETALNDLKYRAPEEDNSLIDLFSQYTALKSARNSHPVRVEFYHSNNAKPTYVNYNESLKPLFPAGKKASKIKLIQGNFSDKF